MIIIPALNPKDELYQYVLDLIQNGFSKLILINDGSSTEARCIFDKIAEIDGCEVLEHAVNMGKGRSLKDAFNYYYIHYSHDYIGVITVDSDGQHSVQDVVRMEEQMIKRNESLVLGVRDFDSDNVPPKSKFGNKMTKFIMKLLYGGNISDTQTGLRGIPNVLIPSFLTMYGERFEYETNMLIKVINEKTPISEVTIETIYINDNSETHFRPVVDSWKIYKLIFGTFFKFMFSSISASVVDLLFFNIFLFCFAGGVSTGCQIGLASVFARVISALYNYLVNRSVVFTATKMKHTFSKYVLLCIVQILFSAASVYGLFILLKINKTVIKMVVDCILFLFSFQIQKRYIFERSK